MNKVKHIRVDYRLIHGQVITKWLKRTEADTIVIVDDQLSNDIFMKDVYKMAAPSGIEVIILSLNKALDEYRKENFYTNNVLLLFKNIATAVAAFEKGMKFEKLQIGGVENSADRKMVFNQISLSLEDALLLKKIDDMGTSVYFQTIPEEEPASLKKIMKKLM